VGNKEGDSQRKQREQKNGPTIGLRKIVCFEGEKGFNVQIQGGKDSGLLKVEKPFVGRRNPNPGKVTRTKSGDRPEHESHKN